jgi:hypothetical protein
MVVVIVWAACGISAGKRVISAITTSLGFGRTKGLIAKNLQNASHAKNKPSMTAKEAKRVARGCVITPPHADRFDEHPQSNREGERSGK